MQNNEIIRPNSESYNLDEKTLRFSGADWFKQVQEESLLLGGMGGIMSWTALLLARMKPLSITMYDPDTIETVNMAGQLFRKEDIGQHKVDAAANILNDFADYHNIMAIPKEFKLASTPKKIMISGFDNMKARTVFFTVWKGMVDSTPEEDRKDLLYIDARLNAEEFQVLCLTGDDNYSINKYEKNFLFSDDSVEEAVCSYKQTAYCANLIAGIITNLFVNFCYNKAKGEEIRELPFFTSYHADYMLLR